MSTFEELLLTLAMDYDLELTCDCDGWALNICPMPASEAVTQLGPVGELHELVEKIEEYLCTS